MFDFVEEAIESAGPRDAAEAIGLHYVSDASPGTARKKAGSYRRADGARVTDGRTLERIRSLVIPPAWTDVWICASPNGHIQATGRDAGAASSIVIIRYFARRARARSTSICSISPSLLMAAPAE